MYYGIQGLYPTAKIEDFVFPGFYHFFEFDRAQAQAFAGFNFQMTIEMLDAFDDAVAFSHAGAGSQGDCVALLSAADLSMGFMGIAPGRAAVDEGFKLAGNVRPIGGSNRDDAVCPLKFVDDFVHVVMLDTLRGVVTGAAAFAEAETVIINADAFERIFFPQTLGDDFHNFRSGTVSHRTAVYHQSIHIFPPSFKNSNMLISLTQQIVV